MYVLFILLISASSLVAQPWQWQQYQGTFWHQTPEEIPWVEADEFYNNEYGRVVAGDFNGNERDEILSVGWPLLQFNETHEIGDIEDWDETWRSSFHGSDVRVLFMQAINLDSDPNDELVTYTMLYSEPYTPFVRVFDLDDNTPPNFIERPDLVESLAFPGFPSPSMFGDFDGDTLLDGFVLTGNGMQYFERENGAWILRETLNAQPYSDTPLYLAADINSDGDMEVGFYEPGIDCNCMFGYLFDYQDGVGIVQSFTDNVLLYPGDYDGDGNTEAFMEGFELSLPSTLVRLSAGEPFTATEVANQWEASAPVVFSSTASGTNRLYSFYNGERFEMGTWRIVPAGYTMQWSDSCWNLTGNGMYYGNVYEGNTANIDEDDGIEYIYRMLVADLFGPNIEVWYIGYGNLQRFFNNQDTVFTNPRIGNILGDRAGELVTRVASGAPVGLYFYELELENHQVIAHHQPYLSEGLPTNMTEFTLADIDNDGQTELFIHTGFWRAFFWRSGHWEEYANILPAGIGLNLYFADFEGDGDLDIFAQNGVWLSLTPSAADDPVVAPSSFNLSSYPNPFNAQTTITFDLPRAGDVTLRLFDVLGREVETIMDKPFIAGVHTVHYDAASLPSGVYFAELTFGATKLTHKLLLLK